MDPSASTVYARCGPHSVPVGRFGLPADTAAVTSSRPIPRAPSAFGSTWIRTAYLPDPNTCTCATPLTVDRRCARNVSAYSSNTDSGSVPDVRARYRIGESAGFDLLYDGGCMPGGSWRRVLEIAACTSWAAASMSRDRVNCKVMFVPPSVLDDVIASMPAIVENCFSSGVATAAAIVWGLAPGSPAETVSVGESTFGRSLTGSSRYAIIPNMRMPNITSVVATGRRINSPEMLTSRQLHPRRPFRSSVRRGYRPLRWASGAADRRSRPARPWEARQRSSGCRAYARPSPAASMRCRRY